MQGFTILGRERLYKAERVVVRITGEVTERMLISRLKGLDYDKGAIWPPLNENPQVTSVLVWEEE